MRIVDLTMTLDEKLPIYPGHPEFELTKLASFAQHGKELSRLVLGTHMGTHIDAPRHYVEGGGTVEHIPLETLCGPAQVVNLSYYSGAVEAADLAFAMAGLNRERVLLRFDGDKKLRDGMDYYYKQPWLTEDAAHWLVDQGCKLVGMDTPMPDGPENTKTMPVHKILLGAGVVIVEYMVNLAAIQAETFDLIVAPLKIKEGDGAPARCFAIVND